MPGPNFTLDLESGRTFHDTLQSCVSTIPQVHVDMLMYQKDEQYVLTPWFLFVFGNFSKECAKQAIQLLDVEHTFNKISEGLGVPNNVKKAAERLYEEEYKDELLELGCYKNSLKVMHPGWWRLQPSLPSSEPIVEAFLRSSECVRGMLCALQDEQVEEHGDTFFTLESAVQTYKASNELLKSISNKSLDEYCVDSRSMLNIEHKKEYQELVAVKMKELGLPTSSDYVNGLNLRTKKVLTYRISLSRQPATELGHETLEKLFRASIGATRGQNVT